MVVSMSVPTGYSINTLTYFGGVSGKKLTFGGKTNIRPIEIPSNKTVPKKKRVGFHPLNANVNKFLYKLSNQGKNVF